MKNNRDKSPLVKKISMVLLALLPILAWYKIPLSIGLGYLGVLFMSLLVIVKYKFKINVVPSIFWLVFFYVCFMWMYNHDFAFWTLMPPGGWVFFLFFLALIWGVLSFDLELLKKYMRWVVLISGVLFWFQILLLITTGSQKFCFVPNLTGGFTYESFSYADIVAKHLRDNTPCSIFLEKSYLAYYFLTYLVLIWFAVKDNGKLFSKEILFVISTLIASRSGSALVGLAIIFTIKMFSVFWSASIRTRMALLLFALPIVIGGVYFYINSTIGQQMMQRSQEFSSEQSSGYTRVVGGYVMFEQLNLNEQVAGIPDARERFGIDLLDGGSFFFVNGIQSILLNLGYIGLFLYSVFYIRLFRNVSMQSKMIILILLIMGLLESNYLNPYMILLTIIPCSEYYRIKIKHVAYI